MSELICGTFIRDDGLWIMKKKLLKKKHLIDLAYTWCTYLTCIEETYTPIWYKSPYWFYVQMDLRDFHTSWWIINSGKKILEKKALDNFSLYLVCISNMHRGIGRPKHSCTARWLILWCICTQSLGVFVHFLWISHLKTFKGPHCIYCMAMALLTEVSRTADFWLVGSEVKQLCQDNVVSFWVFRFNIQIGLGWVCQNN